MQEGGEIQPKEEKESKVWFHTATCLAPIFSI